MRRSSKGAVSAVMNILARLALLAVATLPPFGGEERLVTEFALTPVTGVTLSDAWRFPGTLYNALRLGVGGTPKTVSFGSIFSEWSSWYHGMTIDLFEIALLSSTTFIR